MKLLLFSSWITLGICLIILFFIQPVIAPNHIETKKAVNQDDPNNSGKLEGSNTPSTESTDNLVDYSQLDYTNVVNDTFGLKISSKLFQSAKDAFFKFNEIKNYVASHPISPCRLDKNSKDLSPIDFGVILCDHRSHYSHVWNEYFSSHLTYIQDLKIYNQFLLSQIENKIGSVILDKKVSAFLSVNIRHLIHSIAACISVTEHLHSLLKKVHLASTGPTGEISSVEPMLISYAFNQFSSAYAKMLPHLVLLLDSYSAAVSFLRPVKKMCFNSGLVKPVQRTAKLAEFFSHFKKLPTLMDIFHATLFQSIGKYIDNKMPSTRLLPLNYFKPQDLQEIWPEKVTVAELNDGKAVKYRNVSLVFNTWYMGMADDTPTTGESIQLGEGLDPVAKQRMADDVKRQWLSEDTLPVWDLHAYELSSKESISGTYIKLFRRPEGNKSSKEEVVIKIPWPTLPKKFINRPSLMKLLKSHQKLSLPADVLKFSLQ